MTIVQVNAGNHRQLQNIANTLALAKKIVMVTGAGISTNCGIPDFRSQDGLYSLIQAHSDSKIPSRSQPKIHKPRDTSKPRRTISIPSNIKGKDLFDSMIWNNPTSTSVFYQFIASLRQTIQDDIKSSTPTHRFIRTLRDRRKLVRCYTQNIDRLEAREGLSTDLTRGKGNRSRFTKRSLDHPPSLAHALPGGDLDPGCEVVQLHGDIHTLRCTLCQQSCCWDDIYSPQLLAGKPPLCDLCVAVSSARKDRGKRGTKIGTLRPNIVLYGEEHPSADDIGKISSFDLAMAPDVLLIMGTSLHVHGLKILVREFAKSVHARPGGKGKVIFVNLSKPAESAWKDTIDYWVNMDCDAWVSQVRRCRPDIWSTQSVLDVPSVKRRTIGTTESKKFMDPSTPRKPPSPRTPEEEADKENHIPLPPTSTSTPPPSKSPRPIVLLSTPQKRPLHDRCATTPTPAQRASPIRPTEIPETPPPPTRSPPPTNPHSRKVLLPNTEDATVSNLFSYPSPSVSGSSVEKRKRKRKGLLESYMEFFSPSRKRVKTGVGIWEEGEGGA